MDFSLSPDLESYRARIEIFVRDRLIPLEADPASYDAHENILPALLETLRAEARASGLWALQVPKAWGGQGLPVVGHGRVLRSDERVDLRARGVQQRRAR